MVISLGARSLAAGAGDQEDQRRLLLLVGEGAAQPLVVKENRRFLSVRDDIQHELPGTHLCGKLGHETCRGPEDRGLVSDPGDRVAIAVIRRKAWHGQQDEAGDEQKSQAHHVSPIHGKEMKKGVPRYALFVLILPVTSRLHNR